MFRYAVKNANGKFSKGTTDNCCGCLGAGSSVGAVGAIGLPANLSKNLSAAALYCTAHGCGATSKIELPILINIKRQAIKFSKMI